MANANKDTIYIDVDDEITGIIDKVKTSESKVVALVLPKRATVFQSIVNMKLLKKAADSSSKNVALITTEAGLMPLAGAAGIHIAKTLTSKPEIPSAPIPIHDSEEALEEEAELAPSDGGLDQNKTLGELARDESPASSPASSNGVETVTLDNTEPEKEKAADAAKKEPKAKSDSSKKDKKLKIPNFERFRKYIFIGIGILIILALILVFASSAFAKATITIKTNGTNVDTNLNLNLLTSATSVDPGSGTIPAKQASEQKTFSQQVGTTGQKNTGNKASGTVSMSAQVCGTIPNGSPDDVPAGTGLSSNGNTYITQQDTSFSQIPSGPPSNHCYSYNATSDTTVVAQNAGSAYNNATSFSVAGRSDVSVSVASTISGGTDNIVQVVNQNDIDNAKSKISANDSSVKSDLVSQLKGDGYYPISATYNVGTPNVTSSNNVGDVASNVTVTETITYTMFGVHQSDLKTLVDNSVAGQIDPSKQSILTEGLDNAVFNVTSLSANGGQITMSTVAEAGPDINVNTIKQAAAGHQSGDIKSQINTYPGVTDVTVKISPFWSSTAPKNTSKITVNIAKPSTTVKSS